MKKVVFAVATLLMAASGYAQVTYSIVTDDPVNYRVTTAYLDLLTLDTYLGTNFGSALKLETVVADEIMPWIQVKYTWDHAARIGDPGSRPIVAGGQKHQQIVDAGAAWYMGDQQLKKNVAVTISSHTHGRWTFKHYIEVPATVRRMFGPEAGVHYSRPPLDFEEDSHPLYKYRSADGKYEMPIDKPGAVYPAGDFKYPSSTAQLVSPYVGAHYRAVRNVVIAIDKDKRSAQDVHDLYADVMFAAASKIDDVVDVNGQSWQIIPQKGATRQLGWRIGYVTHHTSSFSWEYSIEIGQRPGPKLGKTYSTDGSYVTGGIGLSLGFYKGFRKPAVKKPDQS